MTLNFNAVCEEPDNGKLAINFSGLNTYFSRAWNKKLKELTNVETFNAQRWTEPIIERAVIFGANDKFIEI